MIDRFLDNTDWFAVGQGIFQQTEDAPHPIPPSDLLALCIGASIVGDANFVDPDARDPRHLDIQLGVKGKSFLPHGYFSQHRGPHKFVAGVCIR